MHDKLEIYYPAISKRKSAMFFCGDLRVDLPPEVWTRRKKNEKWHAREAKLRKHK